MQKYMKEQDTIVYACVGKPRFLYVKLKVFLLISGISKDILI